MKSKIESLMVGFMAFIILLPIIIELFKQVWEAFMPLFGSLFALLLIAFIFFSILEKLRVWK